MSYQALENLSSDDTTSWGRLLLPVLPARPDYPTALRVWRKAFAESETALNCWFQLGGRDAYLRFRAAQDREDAALDVLSAVAQR